MPEENGKSKNGFSKMPTDTHLYKLKDIIHLADKEDDSRIEDITPVSSLEAFSSQYEAELESELDGEDFD